jgi:membrane dipeptidase
LFRQLFERGYIFFMDYFDLHCDTATEIYKKKSGLDGEDFNVTLQKTDAYGRFAQVFAVWIDDSLRGEPAWEYFCNVSDYFKNEIKKHTGRILFCRTPGGLREAYGTKRKAALLSIEGGAALAGNIGNVGKAYEKGVRLLTLTWNGKCELGCGCMCGDGGGLTGFGKDTVREMQSFNMVVDVSHLSEKGFWDVARVAKRPFTATHSDSKAVCKVNRNLTDAQFTEIARGGGIVGINMCAGFLGGASGVEAALKHIGHFLDLGGEKAVAVGADFDGCTLPADINGADSMVKLYGGICGSFGKETADDIFYNNAYNFFINNI